MTTAVSVVAIAAVGAGCASGVGGASTTGPGTGKAVAVGAENEYADVIRQIGGPYVSVTAIASNPNTDPHEFESSPAVANEVTTADLVVQNGLGYDDYMAKIEQSVPSAHRVVVDVQSLLHLPSSTPNPHLWYEPSTMSAVAVAVADRLGQLEPAHEPAFEANLRRFQASLAPLNQAIAELRSSRPGAEVATTEPVADYLLEAAGIQNLTPWSFQADVMNGVDPSPQDVSAEEQLVSGHVAALVYNRQVTDGMTQSLLAVARSHHVPSVGVYETMPVPGYDYQSWMLAEVQALERAIAHGVSAPRL